MNKKNRKIFLTLGSLVAITSALPLIAASCESSLKSKLNKSLKTNKKYRLKLEEKLNIPSKFENFKKDILSELNEKLTGITNKNKRSSIYQEIIAKVNESNENLSSMYDSIE